MRGHLFSGVALRLAWEILSNAALHPAGNGDCETPAENADDARSDAPYDASTRRTKVQLRRRAGVT
jgi:hypothetical protein